MGVIDRSMAFITQPALEATLANQGGIRIGFTAKLPIGFGELPLDWLARCASRSIGGRLFLVVVLFSELLELLARRLLDGG